MLRVLFRFIFLELALDFCVSLLDCLFIGVFVCLFAGVFGVFVCLLIFDCSLVGVFACLLFIFLFELSLFVCWGV